MTVGPQSLRLALCFGCTLSLSQQSDLLWLSAPLAEGFWLRTKGLFPIFNKGWKRVPISWSIQQNLNTRRHKHTLLARFCSGLEECDFAINVTGQTALVLEESWKRTILSRWDTYISVGQSAEHVASLLFPTNSSAQELDEMMNNEWFCIKHRSKLHAHQTTFHVWRAQSALTDFKSAIDMHWKLVRVLDAQLQLFH